MAIAAYGFPQGDIANYKWLWQQGCSMAKKPTEFELARRTRTQDGESTTVTDESEIKDGVRFVPSDDMTELFFEPTVKSHVTFVIKTGEVTESGEHFENLDVLDNDNIVVSFTDDYGPGGETTIEYEFEVEW